MNTPHSISELALHGDPNPQPELRCSFCHERRTFRRFLLQVPGPAVPPVAICDQCIDACAAQAAALRAAALEAQREAR